MTIEPLYPLDYDATLEISHVEKYNWKSKAARERWREPLGRCRDNYQLVEILAVASDENPREVAVIDRGQLRNQDVVNLISKHNLQTAVQHNKVFISNNEGTAKYASENSEDGNHYGYPDCCIEAYEDGDEETLPIYEIACRSENAVTNDDRENLLLEDPDPLLNVIWQYLGYQFISHVPCSFDCEQSHLLAKHHGQLYRELGLGDEAEDLWEFLGTPVTWSGYHGLSNILNGYLIGSTNTPEYWSEKEVVWGKDHAASLL